jgi:hypothetical protein
MCSLEGDLCFDGVGLSTEVLDGRLELGAVREPEAGMINEGPSPAGRIEIVVIHQVLPPFV